MLPETSQTVVTSEVLSTWLRQISDAVAYLNVIKDSVYHNRDMCAHIAKLNRVKIDMASINTYLEHGS